MDYSELKYNLLAHPRVALWAGRGFWCCHEEVRTPAVSLNKLLSAGEIIKRANKSTRGGLNLKKFFTSIALCATLSMALMIPAFAEGDPGTTDFGNGTFVGTTAGDNNGDGIFDGNNNNNNRMNNFNTNGRGNNNNNNNNGNYRARAAGGRGGDNGVDWGWLGLLGLIGLAGMRNRNRERG